jgi:hypothetical protein
MTDLARGDKCLNGAVSLWVVGQELVEQRIANLVGNLVRMSLPKLILMKTNNSFFHYFLYVENAK